MSTTGRFLRTFSIVAVATGVALLVGGFAYAVRGGVGPSTADAAAAAPASSAVHGHATALLRRLAEWKAPAVPVARPQRAFATSPRVVTITVPASAEETAAAPVATESAPPPTEAGDDASDGSTGAGSTESSSTGGAAGGGE